MYRVTNLSQPDVASTLPLPELSNGPRITRSKGNILDTFKQEKIFKNVVGLLHAVDVGYLTTRRKHVGKIESGEGARGELLRVDRNIFDVNATMEDPKVLRRRPKIDPVPKFEAEFDTVSGLLPEETVKISKNKRKNVVSMEAPEATTNNLVGVFQDFLDETFDQTDVVLEENGNVPQGEREGRLTVPRLKKLNHYLEELKRCGKLSTIPDETINRLVTLLDNHLRIGSTLLLNVDEEDDSDEFDNVMVSMDSSLAILFIMTAPDMSKQIYREETIDSIVELVRHHTTQNVYVAYDASYYQLYRSHHDEDEENSKKKKKRKSTTPARSGLLQVKSGMRILSSRLSVLYRTLAELSNVVRVQDSTMLSLCSTAISTICVDDIQYLQLGSLQVVAKVFAQYSHHRTMILDELLNSLLKIPTTGRKLRMFSLAGEDNVSIQMATALLLQCLQSCLILPDPSLVTSIEEADTVKANESYRAATVWTSYFWQEFLKRFVSAKVQEVKFQLLIDNFLTDVLTVYNQPEWPAAQLLLQGLCVQLMGPYGLQSAHAAVRSMATDLLGKMLAKMRKDAVDAAAEDGLWSLAFDQPHQPIKCTDYGCSDMDIEVLKHALDASRRQLQWVAKKFAEEGDVSDISLSFTRNIELRQLLLGHLIAMDACQTDHTSHLAQDFHICHWTKEDLAPQPAIIHCTRLQEAKKAFNQQHQLPHHLAVRLTRWLTQQQPTIKKNYTSLLKRMMSMLEDPASAAREKVIKSLGSVFESDLGFLEDEIVQNAVERRLSDGAISVRRAVVELLGKCIELQPKYAERYYAAIVDRITDVGLSVRKCVLNILRECTQSPHFHKKQEALVRIMLRIRDSEPSIQEAVTQIFADRWVSISSSAAVYVPIQERTQEILLVIWQVYSALKVQGQVSLPLTNGFAPVDLFQRLLAMEDVTGGARSLTKQICACLVEGILCAKEATSDGELSQVSQKETRVLPYVLALHALCTADPSLCVPSDHPLRFVRTLQPYLELSSPTAQEQKVEVDEAQQLQCILAVIDSVLSLQQDVPESLAASIKGNLEMLIKRHPFHGVLFFTARCMCTLAITDAATRKTVTSLLKRFSGLLDSCIEKISEQKIMVHVRRALFITGQLCRFGAAMAAEHPDIHPNNIVNSSDCLKTFLKYMQPSMNLEMRCCALQAAGFVLTTQPQLLLAADGHMDQIMLEALKPSAPQTFKEQALLNLCDMVKEEETHMIKCQGEQAKAMIEGAQAELEDQTTAAIPTINGLGDNCVSGGVVQRYWDNILVLATHLENNSAKVRLKVLQLAEAVLRHGLVHPMSCIPMLMALQCDPEKTIQRLASRLLSQLHSQHSSFVTDRLADGIILSFQFQKQFNPTGISQEGRSCANSIYELFKGSRVSRNRFLSLLLRRFEDSSIEREALPFMCFLADILASLNYGQMEEPLFVVHNLNRLISLRGSSISDQLMHNLASPKEENKESTPTPVKHTSASGCSPSDVPDKAPEAEPSLEAESASAALEPSRVNKASRMSDKSDSLSKAEEGGASGSATDPTANPNTVQSTNPLQHSPATPLHPHLSEEQRYLQLQNDCNSSVALSIMLLLKRHLRNVYALTDQRVQGFNPTEVPRGEPAVCVLEDTLSLETLDIFSSSDNERIAKQHGVFKSLMKEDANDFATEYKVVGKGRKTPGTGGSKKSSVKRKKRVRRGPEEGESEGEQDKGSEEDEDFQRTAKKLAPMLA